MGIDGAAHAPALTNLLQRRGRSRGHRNQQGEKQRPDRYRQPHDGPSPRQDSSEILFDKLPNCSVGGIRCQYKVVMHQMVVSVWLRWTDTQRARQPWQAFRKRPCLLGVCFRAFYLLSGLQLPFAMLLSWAAAERSPPCCSNSALRIRIDPLSGSWSTNLEKASKASDQYPLRAAVNGRCCGVAASISAPGPFSPNQVFDTRRGQR